MCFFGDEMGLMENFGGKNKRKNEFMCCLKLGRERKLLCGTHIFSTWVCTKLFSPKWRVKKGENAEAYGVTKIP